MNKPLNLSFHNFCVSIGSMPSTYIESLSYYEQVLWLCKYLEEEVIPTINNNSEVFSEIQKLFEQLQDFINHYFDNLDVQEEINNKLDEMALNGSLDIIINKYISNKMIRSYNNIEEMKKDTSLFANCKVKTFGYYEANDGGESDYIIVNDDTLTDDGGSVHDLENGLKAKLIIKNGIINIKQFGAYGDGEHDDTVAINSFLNSDIKSAFFPERNL